MQTCFQQPTQYTTPISVGNSLNPLYGNLGGDSLETPNCHKKWVVQGEITLPLQFNQLFLPRRCQLFVSNRHSPSFGEMPCML